MAQRRFHGFKSIGFVIVDTGGTDGTGEATTNAKALAAVAAAGENAVGGVTIELLGNTIAEPGVEGGEASELEYVEQEGNPLDEWGNKLPGVQYLHAKIRARNLPAYVKLKAAWDAGNLVYWRWVLDNDERWHTNVGQRNWMNLAPTNVTAKFQGTANQFAGDYMIPEQFITKTIT